MRRRLNREDRQEEVLAATKSVLAKHGYYGTTVPKINDTARTSQGTFYRYFDSCDAAVLHLVEVVRLVRYNGVRQPRWDSQTRRAPPWHA